MPSQQPPSQKEFAMSASGTTDAPNSSNATGSKPGAQADASKKVVGKVIGGYELIQEVGRGAMGVVFKARQLSMDRVVALKFLPPSHATKDTRVQRFIREARAAGQLNHPNIVAVHDVGQADGIYYISMEFVDGSTVHKRIKNLGAFSESETIALGLQ